MVGWKWQMKHWSALKTGLMPAELTSRRGEKGFFGSGSMGGTFGGCCEQVSQEPSSSDTRRRLSLKRALSLSVKPGMGLGMVDAGFGRGPGSCALNRAATVWDRIDAVTTAPNKTVATEKRVMQ